MTGYPDREIVEHIRKEYPVGTRVELVRMDDPQAPPVGTRGTVTGVDDIGSLQTVWDSGSRLNVVYGEDEVRKVATCPICGREYSERPALSRTDNKTAICPVCGIRQALESAGLAEDEQEKIIKKLIK